MSSTAKRPSRSTVRSTAAIEARFEAAPFAAGLADDDASTLHLPHPVRRLFGESRGVTWAVGFILLALGMLLVRPMAMSLLSWHRTAAMLDERRTEVDQLERRNDELRQQVEYYRTSAYIVEQARVYGMLAPGERGLVIRELAHPESASRYTTTRLRNATVDRPSNLVR